MYLSETLGSDQLEQNSLNEQYTKYFTKVPAIPMPRTHLKHNATWATIFKLHVLEIMMHNYTPRCDLLTMIA